MLRRLTCSLAAAALVPAGLAVSVPSTASGAPEGPGAATTSAASPAAVGKPARYRATIEWTKHGIPHITADDFGSLGFGSGYAAAGASLCTLADTLVTGRGERSLWFGPKGRYNDQVTLDASNLQVDTVVGDLRNRRVVEKLLRDKVAGPGKQARAMVRGYTAGLNTYLREEGRTGVTDPACKGAGYLKPDVTPLDLWYGVYLANLLASTGVFIPEIADAAPPTLTDPGLPELPLRAADVDKDALLKGFGRDPDAPFGSNATAAGGRVTSTGKGMLLGNPHFPWKGRYKFTQQHQTIPGRYDVAGASLIGSPAINIGWNKDVAWSHTVSTAYRFTPYEYRLLGPTSYLTESGPKQLQRHEVRVKVRRGGKVRTVTEDVWRTAQGYVVDDPAQLMPWSPLSVWAIRDANAEHLRTLDTFLDMGKARDVRDLLRRQDRGGGMPWVNTTAADRKGDVLYADHSVVPHVTNAMEQRCLTVVGRVIDTVAGLPGLDGTRAESDCAWGADADAQRPGILGPRNLPSVVRRDWVMNANDSYWLPHPASRLEGFPSIIGCERCERTMRTRVVADYVARRLAKGRKETPASFRGHQHENRVMAAEVMRADGALDRVCSLTGETDACAALRTWDGRSDRDSRGVHLFEAFVERLPALPLDLVDTVWTVPFSAADPLNTPRGLNWANPGVVQAMADAIAAVREAGVPFDARWGSLQVAGDRGAPAIGLGGGDGDELGNANVLSSRNVTKGGRYKPITYGSSHIQAISYRRGGGLDARTILTYGQSEDPASPWSSDQTRLFAQEKWVRFPWTDAQVRRDLVRRKVVTGR
ncbi:penicillin acylase family protein [Nocardioides deserti]|uniref:Penicillin acylase family protein n=1 Tax=Nocardioides deserti TaxID=1588644 RepID=A0ABR6U8Z1_9ACTN|nr:penicillin acylase family protein [Nocardioides deserti]MBC2960578.1 penicillin acylase family protein [Nocardioides deserti]GGO70963.1 penicillin amidase [Nocardioides deserti]